jgi:hypothetical protein
MKTLRYFCWLAATLSLVVNQAHAEISPRLVELDAILSDLGKTVDSIQLENCSATIADYYSRFLKLELDKKFVDVDELPLIERLVEDSFAIRTKIKDLYKDYPKTIEQTPAQDACMAAGKELIRALRYAEDYLIEWRARLDPTVTDEFVNMTGRSPYLIVNPKYKDQFHSYEDLASGDVIVSRGNAFTSALIAKMVEADYQFSHQSFVYRDKDNALWTSEAHIEIGSIASKIQRHLDEKNARSAVFRYKDQGIAALASEKMINYIKDYKRENKSNVPYDFQMDETEHKKMYCSEDVKAGFSMVGVDIPRFESRLQPGIGPLVRTLGVNAKDDKVRDILIFAPGDLQVDPDFEEVAEWRHPLKLLRQRYTDAILTKLLSMMTEEGYRYDPTFMDGIEARFGWSLRRIPLLNLLVVEKFPLNMKVDMLEVNFVIDQVGKLMLKDLEEQAKAAGGIPLSMRQISASLESYVAQEQARAAAGHHSKFLRMFHK